MEVDSKTSTVKSIHHSSGYKESLIINPMFSDLVMLKSTFRTSSIVGQDALQVKHLLWAQYNFIVAHVYNYKSKKSFLVCFKKKGPHIWQPLSHKNTDMCNIQVKKLNKYEYITFCSTSGSIDKIYLSHNLQEWSVVSVRLAGQSINRKYEPQMLIFSQSQMFCVVEQIPNKQNLRFTFYPNQSKEMLQTKPLKKQISSYVNKSQKIYQINDHSMVGWVQTTSNKFMTIKYYDINSNNSTAHTIQVPQVLGLNQKGKTQLSIKQIISISKIPQSFKKYLIYCQCLSISDYKIKSKQFLVLEQSKNESYFVSRITSKSNHYELFKPDQYFFRAFGHFRICQKQDCLLLFEQMLDGIKIGPQKNLVLNHTKHNYIQHNEKISPYSFYHKIKENKLAKTILVQMITQFELKPMYMHMLLYINDDFDDDLLQDIIEHLVN